MIHIDDEGFRNADWRGATTEKLDWKNPDYNKTAGIVIFKEHPTTNSHIYFVDVLVRTNDGREIVLERIEGGKLESQLRHFRRAKIGDGDDD